MNTGNKYTEMKHQTNKTKTIRWENRYFCLFRYKIFHASFGFYR